jgi:hypothetical protein
MAEENQAQEHEPLFSEAEMIAVTITFLTLDILDLFEVGIPATDLVSWGVQAYQYKKGTSGTFQVVSAALEALPFADYLPIRTGALLLLFWGDHHPDSKLNKLIKVAEVVSELEGKGGKSGAGPRGPSGVPRAANDNVAAGAGGRGEVAQETVAMQAGTASGGEGSAGTGGGGSGGANSEEFQRHRERFRQGKRSATGEGQLADMEEGVEGEEEERRLAALSPEGRELEEILSGDYVGRSIRQNLGTDEILARIGNQELGATESRFNQDQAIQPKKPVIRAANDNERYNIRADNNNEEEVDLRKASGQ